MFYVEGKKRTVVEAAEKRPTSSCCSFVETPLLCPLSPPSCAFALERKKQLSLPTWVSKKKYETASSYKEEICNFTNAVVIRLWEEVALAPKIKTQKQNNTLGTRKKRRPPFQM